MSGNTPKLIETLWEAARKNIQPENYEPTDIKSVISECDEVNKSTSLLEEALPIFDEYATWFISLSGLLIVLLMKHRRHKFRHKWRALTTVISGIVSQLIAVRRLVLSGLDLPAKQILRCLVEHTDLAVRLSLDDRMVAEYLRHNRVAGERGAKKFWQSYLRTNKEARLRDRMYQEYKARGISDSFIRKVQRYRQTEEGILNACTHPSFAALSINVVGVNPSNKTSGLLPFCGIIDETSLRTIHYAVYVLSEYVILGYLPSIRELSKVARAESFIRGGCSHLHGGRIVLLGLCDYLARGY